VLAEEPGSCVIAGAVCRPWDADLKFVALAAERFAEFWEPDQVKIAWTLDAEPLGPAWTQLATETRAVATDKPARKEFRRY
jgi:hypothetical protein